MYFGDVFLGNITYILYARFRLDDIPPTSTINSSKITLTGSAANSVVPLDTSIELLDTDGSWDGIDGFKQINYADNVTLNNITSSVSVPWNGVPTWSIDGPIDTPDLSSLVNQRVASGYIQGQYIGLRILDGGAITNTVRQSYSFDHLTGNPPLLTVNYNPPA